MLLDKAKQTHKLYNEGGPTWGAIQIPMINGVAAFYISHA